MGGSIGRRRSLLNENSNTVPAGDRRNSRSSVAQRRAMQLSTVFRSVHAERPKGVFTPLKFPKSIVNCAPERGDSERNSGEPTSFKFKIPDFFYAYLEKNVPEASFELPLRQLSSPRDNPDGAAATVAGIVAGACLDGVVPLGTEGPQPTENTRGANWVQTCTNGPERSAKPLCAGSIPARASNLSSIKSII